MKVKRLLTKLGVIAICLVMGACSVVGSSAAEAGSEVSSVGSGYSEGTGRRDLTLETTGQRLSCKKGYRFELTNVKVARNFTMPQIKLGKGETFKFYLYNTYIKDVVGCPAMIGIYKPTAVVKKKGFGYDYIWTGEYNRSSVITGLSNKTRVAPRDGYATDRYTVSIKGSSKCTYRLVAFDNYVNYGAYGKPQEATFWGYNITNANTLYNKYPVVAVSVYNAPKSVTLKRSDNKSSIAGKTITLKRGKTLSVYESTPSGTYANAKNVTYTSSNKGVATVTKNGTFKSSAKIKAIKKGTATITVRLYNGKTSSVKIRVV